MNSRNPSVKETSYVDKWHPTQLKAPHTSNLAVTFVALWSSGFVRLDHGGNSYSFCRESQTKLKEMSQWWWTCFTETDAIRATAVDSSCFLTICCWLIPECVEQKAAGSFLCFCKMILIRNFSSNFKLDTSGFSTQFNSVQKYCQVNSRTSECYQKSLY